MLTPLSQGFYTDSGLTSAYFEQPVLVNANVTGGRGHVMADKLVMLHFVLSDLADAPSPVNAVYELMHSYLGDALYYEKVVFDLLNRADQHESTMKALLKKLER